MEGIPLVLHSLITISRGIRFFGSEMIREPVHAPGSVPGQRCACIGWRQIPLLGYGIFSCCDKNSRRGF